MEDIEELKAEQLKDAAVIEAYKTRWENMKKGDQGAEVAMKGKKRERGEDD